MSEHSTQNSKGAFRRSEFEKENIKAAFLLLYEGAKRRESSTHQSFWQNETIKCSLTAGEHAQRGVCFVHLQMNLTKPTV